MSEQFAKVLAHAEEILRLPDRRHLSRAELLKFYKSFLKQQQNRIRLRHNAGAGGIEVATALCRLADLVLSELYEEAAEGAEQRHGSRPHVQFIATGGYGRGLLNPFSDIDVLFLFKGKGAQPTGPAKEMIEEILYMLWDVGFKLSHAVRSAQATISLASTDFETRTALIEARLIAGDQKSFAKFLNTFHEKCIAGREDEYLRNRLDDLYLRHEKHLGTVYVQEPNVKSGVGSLRDYHNIVWITYVKTASHNPKTLVKQGLLQPKAYNDMQRAYDFLHRVRNDLHYEEDRVRDVLTLYLQGVVATHFNYPQRSILRRCEAFMKDYFRHTQRLRQICLHIFDSFQIEQERRKQKGFIPFLGGKKPKRAEFDGFYSEGGRLYPLHDTTLSEDPLRLLRIFQHTQLRHLRLSPELVDLIEQNYHLIDKAFRYNKSNRETFETILQRKGEATRPLRQMHRVGILGRYLPEFGALTCLVQHEFFHRYTADEHTLKTIEAIDNLTDTDNPELSLFRQIYRHINQPELLYIALLLHDTGRAENARQHEHASAMLASKVCSRLQIHGQRRRLIIFLVDHHLTFWKTATTKNLEEPNTINEFAQIVRNKEWLDYLYLLTYADTNGTSTDAWNSWKASLMRQLYDLTKSYLEDLDSFRKRLERVDPDLREKVGKKLSPSYNEEIDAHFRLMPTRYLQTRKANTIAEHLRVFRQFFENLSKESNKALQPAIHWEQRPHEGCSKLIIVTWDRHELLGRITACLAAQNLNILSADIFTRGDDLVMDVFKVCTTDWQPVTNPRTLKEFESDLTEACASSKYDRDKLIAKGKRRARKPTNGLPAFPRRVFISNDSDPISTFIEIQALDRIGLLSDVFEVFASHLLDIRHARINTTKGAALDAFYVNDPKGLKLTDKQIELLQNNLEQAIGV